MSIVTAGAWSMHFWILVPAALFAGLCAPLASAAAQDRSVEMCTVLKQVSGGFTFEDRPDLKVRERTLRPGPFRFDHSGDVVGFTCLRESLVPQPLDVEVLQAGYSLGLSDTGSALRVLWLQLKGGRISWEMIEGRLAAVEQAAVEAAVARMQSSLAPADDR